jgi:hypothetical protein
MGDVADLDTLFESSHNGPKCWYSTRTTPEIRAFLSELEKRMAELGRRPNWKLVVAKLEQDFGLKLTPFTIARHFKKECACPQ